jgi:hypothetical protein
METETEKPIRGRGIVADVVLNFLIFAVCDAVYAIAFGLLMPNLANSASELFATLMVDVYAGAAFFLALLTATFPPKKLRTVWIIGAVGPPVMLLIFFFSLLFKK